jgi:hypothetical protein
MSSSCFESDEKMGRVTKQGRAGRVEETLISPYFPSMQA